MHGAAQWVRSFKPNSPDRVYQQYHPETEKHRGAHQILTERVVALSDTWRRNRDPEDFYELRTFIRDWWVGHILHLDSTLTDYAKGRESDIRAALESLS